MSKTYWSFFYQYYFPSPFSFKKRKIIKRTQTPWFLHERLTTVDGAATRPGLWRSVELERTYSKTLKSKTHFFLSFSLLLTTYLTLFLFFSCSFWAYIRYGLGHHLLHQPQPAKGTYGRTRISIIVNMQIWAAEHVFTLIFTTSFSHTSTAFKFFLCLLYMYIFFPAVPSSSKTVRKITVNVGHIGCGTALVYILMLRREYMFA